jgi:PAS domain S-box-containing protein
MNSMNEPARGTEKDEAARRDLKLHTSYEQMALAYRLVPHSLLISLVPALVLWWAVRGAFPDRRADMWLVVFLAVMVLRFAFGQVYAKSRVTPERIHLWSGIVFAFTLASGLLWGGAGTVLLPVDRPDLQVIAVAVITGIAAGTVSSLGTVRVIFAAFFVPTMLPFTIYQFYLGSGTHILLGVLGLAFLVGMLQNSKRMSHNAEETISSRLTQALMAERVQENEERLAKILDTVQSGVVLVDVETRRIVEANRAAVAMHGGTKEDVETHVCHDVLCPAPERFCPVLDEGKKIDNSMRLLVRKDRSSIPILKTVVPVTINRRKFLLESFVDVTAQKEAEAGLRKEKQRAEEANRAKSEFLAHMSHEIRTPMNGVLGMLGLLIDSRLGEKQKRLADTAYSSANMLLSILNDILDLSKIESGKMSLEAIDFDIREALDEVVRLFSGRVEEKPLRLRSEVDGSVTPMVVGDPIRFRQVLDNLVGNAVKFTDEGEVVVRAMPLEQDDREVFLRFEVSDTGIGIDDEAKKKIFDSFTQADASTTRRHGGTGLGLSISRELVTMMGGTMGVTSEPGKGSTFWFTVRFTRSSAKPVEEANGPSSKKASPKSGRTPAGRLNMLAGRRILLAEDNIVNQKVALAMLSPLSLAIDIAADGREALYALSRQSYDLVLMDCQMPEMDGFEATRRIRAGDAGQSHRSVPIIAMTARAMQGDREKCLEAGMDDYLPKPIDSAVLMDTLDKWMSEGR